MMTMITIITIIAIITLWNHSDKSQIHNRSRYHKRYVLVCNLTEYRVQSVTLNCQILDTLSGIWHLAFGI